MTHRPVFVNRRKGQDRRFDIDPCKDLPMDLFHRMRRKSSDRRNHEKDLSDDYYAYLSSAQAARPNTDDPQLN